MESESHIREPDMQKAIQASLAEFRQAELEKNVKHGDLALGQTSNGTQMYPEKVSSSDETYRPTIEDRIHDISIRQALEMPRLSDEKGDTWVFIGPPMKQPEMSQEDYEQYMCRYKVPIVMRRDILADASETFFKPKLESSTYQHRQLRRLGLVGKLPQNIKYVLDLTPPNEGDEAVHLTASLCCSEGVRLWYQATQVWNVSTVLVGGEEEYTSKRSAKKVITLSNIGGGGSQNTEDNTGIESDGQRSTVLCKQPVNERAVPLEYSPIRHRTAIERVLRAIQGADPNLDSAVKLWTTFAVAQYFEITNSSLIDYIISWLRAYPNSFFLEVLPEVSFRIADGFQVHNLARDSFAILVGEEALDNLYRARKFLRGTHKHTTFGRRREDMSEMLLQRVEYASKNFTDRILHDFDNLVGEDMIWLEQLDTVRKLSNLTKSEMQSNVQPLKLLLKRYMRGSIYKVLCANYASVSEAYLPSISGGAGLFQYRQRKFIWTELQPRERVLTRTFWQALRGVQFVGGLSNLDMDTGLNFAWAETGLNLLEKRMMSAGKYRKVPTKFLERWSEQRWLLRYKHGELVSEGLQFPDLSKLRKRTGLDDADDVYGPVETLTVQQVTVSLPVRPASQMPTGAVGPEDLGKSKQPNLSLSAICNLWDRTPQPQTVPIPHNLFEQQDDPVKSDGETLKEAQSPATFEEGPATETDLLKGFSNAPMPAKGTFAAAAEKQSVSMPMDLDDLLEPSTDSPFIPSLSVSDDSTGEFDAFTPLFDLDTFFFEAEVYLRSVADIKLRPSDYSTRQEPYELGITNTLVCLEDSEWKYLPLWAGGLDDGTSGVYNDDVPQSELGFSTAGPNIHTGTSDYSASDFEMVYDSGSTINTSSATNDGFSSQMHPHRVYAASSAPSTTTTGDDFDKVSRATDEDEEAAARRQIEAMERIEAAEAEAADEARRASRGYHDMVSNDENYADLFGEEADEDSEIGFESDETETGEDFEDVAAAEVERGEDEDTVMI